MRWVITGANRGIGLEFVRQLSARGESVEAGAREPARAKELTALAARADGRVRVHACDVASTASVAAFARVIGNVAVDVLVNNAGVYGDLRPFEKFDLDDAQRTFDVNALGPLRVTRALIEHVLRGSTRRVVSITSGMGSISDNTSGGNYGYRMSKAALNMANRSLSLDYRARGLIAVVMNPGWVRTDMGGRGATLAPADSVRMMLERIDALTIKDSGSFLNYSGGTYPY